MAEAIASSGPVPSAKPKAARKSEFNGATHVLRGIASLMVFWAHLLMGTSEHIYVGNETYEAIITPPWNVGVWGVPLFFTISGFVIMPSVQRYSLSDFAQRRFLRLYPLFFVLSVIYVILNALTNAYPNSNNWETIISGFLFTNLFTGTEQLTPNAWTLTYEVIFYALAALGFHFIIRKRNYAIAALILAASAWFLWRYPIALFFVGGMLIRFAFDADIRPPASLTRILELSMAAIWIYTAAFYRMPYDQEYIVRPEAWVLLFSTVLYFYFAIWPESLSSKLAASKPLIYLGTVSYSLYLIHPYTYRFFREVFDRMGWFTENIPLSMALFFLVVTPITFVVTHIAHKMLEIAPYQWFFKERIYRQNQNKAAKSEAN